MNVSTMEAVTSCYHPLVIISFVSFHVRVKTGIDQIEQVEPAVLWQLNAIDISPATFPVDRMCGSPSLDATKGWIHWWVSIIHHLVKICVPLFRSNLFGPQWRVRCFHSISCLPVVGLGSLWGFVQLFILSITHVWLLHFPRSRTLKRWWLF